MLKSNGGGGGGGDKTKNDLTPEEQDGSDLTRLCQSVHTSV